MSIVVRCAKCGTTFNVADIHAGRRGKCKNCGQLVQIPRAQSESQLPEASEGPADLLASKLPDLKPAAAPDRQASTQPAASALREPLRPPASQSRKPSRLPPRAWAAIGVGGAAVVLLIVLAVVMLGGGSDKAGSLRTTPQEDRNTDSAPASKPGDTRKAAAVPESPAVGTAPPNARPQPAALQGNSSRCLAMLKRLSYRLDSGGAIGLIPVTNMLEDLYRDEGWMSGGGEVWKAAMTDLVSHGKTTLAKLAQRGFVVRVEYGSLIAFRAIVCHACKHPGSKPSQATFEAVLEELLADSSSLAKRLVQKGFTMISVDESFGMAAQAMVCHLYRNGGDSGPKEAYESLIGEIVTGAMRVKAGAPGGMRIDDAFSESAAKMVSGGD